MINTLPQLGEYVKNENGEKTFVNEEQSILMQLTESDELSLFETG